MLTPAQALINLDGQRNQLFIFGNATFGYDSNIFSEANGHGDYTVTGTVGAEIKRRAGIISDVATFRSRSFTRRTLLRHPVDPGAGRGGMTGLPTGVIRPDG